MSKDVLTKGFGILGSEGTTGQALVVDTTTANGAKFAGTPQAYTLTYSTADRTLAAPTAAALTVTDGAGTNNGTVDAITDNASTIAAVQELAAQINKIIADGLDTRQAVAALVTDLKTFTFIS